MMDLFSAEEPCPLDSRRTPRELYVKLFIVNFTVLFSYAHLCHLYRERWMFLHTILAFLSPIGATVLLFLPTFAFVINLAMSVTLSDIKIAALILFRDTRLASISVYVESILMDSHKDDTRRSLSKWSYLRRKVRMSVIPCALISQSAMSIWLFSRRAHRKADAFYDHRVLQLAILGMYTNVKILTHVILEGRLKSHLSRAQLGVLSYPEGNCIVL